MEAEPLDLTLGDEEIEAAYYALDMGIDEIQETDRAIADAAVTKVAYAIVEWMYKGDYWDAMCIDGATALEIVLEAQGISRPEGE